MDRQIYKDILLRMTIENVLYMAEEYKNKRITFNGVKNEYDRQEAEKGFAENATYRVIKDKSGYSNSGIKKIKKKYLGIKKK